MDDDRADGVGSCLRRLTVVAGCHPDFARSSAHRAKQRWPEAFVGPECGGKRGWALETKPWTTAWADCGRQSPVRAETVMHRSKAPLTVWFRVAHLMAAHSNGLSGLCAGGPVMIGAAGAERVVAIQPDAEELAMADHAAGAGRQLFGVATQMMAACGLLRTPSCAIKSGWEGGRPVDRRTCLERRFAPLPPPDRRVVLEGNERDRPRGGPPPGRLSRQWGLAASRPRGKHDRGIDRGGPVP